MKQIKIIVEESESGYTARIEGTGPSAFATSQIMAVHQVCFKYMTTKLHAAVVPVMCADKKTWKGPK